MSLQLIRIKGRISSTISSSILMLKFFEHYLISYLLVHLRRTLYEFLLKTGSSLTHPYKRHMILVSSINTKDPLSFRLLELQKIIFPRGLSKTHGTHLSRRTAPIPGDRCSYLSYARTSYCVCYISWLRGLHPVRS